MMRSMPKTEASFLAELRASGGASALFRQVCRPRDVFRSPSRVEPETAATSDTVAKVTDMLGCQHSLLS